MLAGGNWIIDQVKIIDANSKHEQLANIYDQSQGTGGSPYNVLLDLAKMEAPFPLEGAGLVGQDSLGAIYSGGLQEQRDRSEIHLRFSGHKYLLYRRHDRA